MSSNLDDGRREPALLTRALLRLGAVRRDEQRETLGAFLTLFGFMAGHALLETARDALFLAELSVTLLPWVYLTLAASALLLTRYHSRIGNYFRAGQAFEAWLYFAGASSLVLWLAIFWAGDWIYYLLYAWTGVLATLLVVQFWTLLGNQFTVTQAKRLYALIGIGSVLGAIAGSGAARALTAVLPAEHLVLAAGLVFIATALGTRRLELGLSASGPFAARDYTSADFRHASALVWSRPYLKRIAMAILLATITFTLVDFVFKSTVARLVGDDALGEFFSSVYFTLNLVSLLFQVFVVSWLLRRIGISSALAIMPALLLVGALGFMLSGGLAAVLLLKGADGSLRYSLYRTTSELLFVPVSAEIRGRVKAFIDVVGQRGGQAAGSLLVLLALSLTRSELAVAAIAMLSAGAWLYLIVKLKPDYLNLFRETLQEDITATRIDFPALDMASLETLLSTLNAPDDRRVVAALELLAAERKLGVVPGLILYHPSPAVVSTALELLAGAGRTDVVPIIDRLLGSTDGRLRAACLRARAVLLADQEPLQRFAADEEPAVRATALTGLVAGGWRSIESVRRDLDSLMQHGDADVMLTLASAMRALPSPHFKQLLQTLAVREEPAIQAETIRAMRALCDPAFTTTLIALLPHRQLRPELRDTLVALGPAALSMLGDALADAALPHGTRRQIPRAIAAFGSPQAAAILLHRLLQEPDGMIRFKILRALGKMRTTNSKLPLDRKLLRQAIDQNLGSAFRFMHWRQALEQSAAKLPADLAVYHEMLVELVKDKQTHTLERLFRLMNLEANDEEFVRVYRGLESRRREAVAGSRELIEHMLEPPLRYSVLELVDDLYDPASREAAEWQRGGASHSDILRQLLDSGNESLSSFAAYEIGALGLRGLHGAIERAQSLSPSHRSILEDAAARLGAGGTTEPLHG
jgi:ATP/ADP translocase/HEAT repeat protein